MVVDRRITSGKQSNPPPAASDAPSLQLQLSPLNEIRYPHRAGHRSLQKTCLNDLLHAETSEEVS